MTGDDVEIALRFLEDSCNIKTYAWNFFLNFAIFKKTNNDFLSLQLSRFAKQVGKDVRILPQICKKYDCNWF